MKLADFGVASRLGEIADEEDPAAIAVVGTPYWMAPEVSLADLPVAAASYLAHQSRCTSGSGCPMTEGTQ